MKEMRLCLYVCVVGVLVVGPLTVFVFCAVRFALGLTSSLVFTTESSWIARQGAVTGLIGSLAVLGARSRPLDSAMLSAAVVLAWRGTGAVLEAARGGYPAYLLPQLPAQVAMFVIESGATAYVTALLNTATGGVQVGTTTSKL